jgi:hypothetical protein
MEIDSLSPPHPFPCMRSNYTKHKIARHVSLPAHDLTQINDVTFLANADAMRVPP